MRAHRVGYSNLNRPKGPRQALLRGLARDLFLQERITTTVARAREARRFAEKLITLGKQAGADGVAPERQLHLRRLALSLLPDKAVVKKVFDDIAPRFQTRPGGYTRIVRLGTRKGDAAEVAVLELVARSEAAPSAARGREAS